MKEIIGKRKASSGFPNKQVVNDIEITAKTLIANRLNQSFVNVSLELAFQIPQRKKHFSSYIDAISSTFQEIEITERELK